MFKTLDPNDPSGAKKAQLLDAGAHVEDRFELRLIGPPNYHTADDLQAAGWRVNICETQGKLQSFYCWDEDVARHAAGRLGIPFTRLDATRVARATDRTEALEETGQASALRMVR